MIPITKLSFYACLKCTPKLCTGFCDFQAAEDELSSRLQALSDLAVQSGQLNPASREQTNAHISSLRTEMEQFASLLSERSRAIRNLAKDIESGRKEADDYQKNADSLKQWLDTARNTPLDTQEAEMMAKALEERMKKVRPVCSFSEKNVVVFSIYYY